MESTDSRKRPLDTEGESGASKKSNPGSGGGEAVNMDEIHLKILVPSVAAGAVIGKGGEAVGKLQKDTGAKIKMSKNTECYPGTTERVCLIVGSYEALVAAHEFIMDKIKDKPDLNPRPNESDGGRINFERHKQTKILIPNGTAGVIIGKGGSYIRELKESSGAYVQVSQKAKDSNLQERIVTISGDPESIKKAVGLIVEKFAQDPSSGSCPNVSYGHVSSGDYAFSGADSSGTGGSSGLVQLGNASSNPLGGAALSQALLRNLNSYGGLNIGSGMNNLNIGSAGSRTTEALRSNPAVENLRATLRNSGYTETAADEIALAMATLASYGILGLGLTGGLLGNLMNLNKLSLNGGGSGSILGSSSSQGGGDTTVGRGLSSSGGGSLFGPIGGGSSSTPVSSLFAGDSLFSTPLSNNRGSRDSKSQAHSSFDFDFDDGADNSGVPDTVQDLEIAENLVGALIGQGGRGIIELQSVTGTSINVSKKGVFAPGTRNRVVTVTGSPAATSRALSLIRQKIADAEQRRNAYNSAHGNSN